MMRLLHLEQAVAQDTTLVLTDKQVRRLEYSGRTSNTPSTWSSNSRCCAVTQTLLANKRSRSAASRELWKKGSGVSSRWVGTHDRDALGGAHREEIRRCRRCHRRGRRTSWPRWTGRPPSRRTCWSWSDQAIEHIVNAELTAWLGPR